MLYEPNSLATRHAIYKCTLDSQNMINELPHEETNGAYQHGSTNYEYRMTEEQRKQQTNAADPGLIVGEGD